MCVNNLSKVALDSAAAGIEPAISSRKSNALTTAPPNHITAVVIEMMKEFTREKNRHRRTPTVMKLCAGHDQLLLLLWRLAAL